MISHKPVILAGWGVISANAQQEFYDFIDRVGAPVLLTWKSIGLLPDDHPLYCGRPGGIGQVAANRILQECDMLIVLGAKMDLDQTQYQLDRIAPLANKMIIEIDPEENVKYDSSWWVVCQDVKTYLQFAVDKTDPANCSDWLSYCKQLNADNPPFNTDWWNEEPVNYYCFLDELNRLSRNDDVIAPEMSSFAATALFQTWRVKQGQQFTYAGACGAMGTGIPAAIGAALATGKRVLCPNGDGSFMLNIQELEVVRRLNLPIKFFVLDNGGYMAIKNTQDLYFNGRHVGCDEKSGFTLPNIASVAESFGISTAYIFYNHHIPSTLENTMIDNEPSVTILTIPPDFKLAHTVKKVMVDGKPTSGKFEDV